MKVIIARNVHEALAMGLHLLDREGVNRDSRNGPVVQGPPVATVYLQPMERVLFWEQRDANPFLHLYESLWMLAGRADIAPLARYSAQFNAYAEDDGLMHGAYGRRWRRWFSEEDMPGASDARVQPMNQLELIAHRLHRDPTDRRCVLQMWDAEADLDKNRKDVPCNTIATFQRDHDGALHLHVFCRSNDIIWGAYGANAVHFSFLLEYMARAIGCPVGTYTQVSVNWHAYVNTLTSVPAVRPDRGNFIWNPYAVTSQWPTNQVHVVPMPDFDETDGLDAKIKEILFHADEDFAHPASNNLRDRWSSMVMRVLEAHSVWRIYKSDPERYNMALAVLDGHPRDQQADWIVAAREWLVRRALKANSALTQADFYPSSRYGSKL